MSETKSYTRSISQLKGWTKCGEAYYLERLRKREMPSRPAVWTIMGVAVHDTLMEYERTDRQIDVLKYFQTAYDMEVANAHTTQPDYKYWYLPPLFKSVKRAIDSYKDRGIKQLETYVEYAERAPWEISDIEREFEIDLNGITVRGAVDRILYFPGLDEFVIDDLKTGSPKGEADHRQLGFYAFVARELWDIPVDLGRYWFTKLNRSSKLYELEEFDRDYWTLQFEMLDKGISNNIFLPNPGEQCELCPVKPWCNSQGWLEVGEPLG